MAKQLILWRNNEVKQEWLKYAISELSNSDLIAFSVELLL